MNIKYRLSNKKDRIIWMDLAKGIAIILVIFGHCVHGGIRGIIFSFHMPLFFILSGMTYKRRESYYAIVEYCLKGFKQLIVPSFIVFSICFIDSLIRDVFMNRTVLPGEYFTWKLRSLYYFSGSDIYVNEIMLAPRVGVIWFLLALFLVRIIFTFILCINNKILNNVIPLCLLVLGVVVGSYQWLPVSLDVAFAAVFYYWLGWHSRNYKSSSGNQKNLLMSGFVWVALFCVIFAMERTYLEMSQRRYPLFPISVICSISGSYFIFELSKYFSKFKFTVLFSVIGQYSLDLLCIHGIDEIWMTKLVFLVHNNFLIAGIRIVTDVSLLFAFLYIKQWISQKKKDRR